MSTQHPDNAHIPDWCNSNVIGGNAEVYESYFAFETIDAQEVMWDSEGKDSDTRVVRKLLTEHEDYFKKHIIGEDVFLTYRIPNPRIEQSERKIAVETLQNIPVAHDVASAFYRRDVTPIFEVILPFTANGEELIRLSNYYKKAIVASEDICLDEIVKVRDWVGSFKPRSIQVIPLVEDFTSIINVDRIVRPYIDAFRPKYVRGFIARSDPALNYGLFCAVLLSKLALSKLHTLEEETGVPTYPILGVGSAPFRGHLSPLNCEGFLREYAGLSTATIQSAFRYDYSQDEVRHAVSVLNNNLPNSKPDPIEHEKETSLLEILRKSRQRYEQTLEELAPIINSVSFYVPRRRARKFHKGLFGYGRIVAGLTLPRAIPFTAALYTIGMPPEFIGGRFLDDLNDEEWNTLGEHYLNLTSDLETAAGFLSWNNINMLMEKRREVAERAGMSEEKLKNAITMIQSDLKAVEEGLGIRFGPRNQTQQKHEDLTNNFITSYLEHQESETASHLLESARLRRFLG
jgi:phosphoenolpyruvate carboxylase